MLRQTLRSTLLGSHRLTMSTNSASFGKNSDEIMALSANKATRFVYLRTLPLKQQAELDGRIDEIVSNIETTTEALCNKHVQSVVDKRSAVHLHTTALAIATHRVLSPRIRNEIRLSNIIRAGFGASLTDESPNSGESKQSKSAEKQRPDFWIVRAALWFSFNRMAAIRKMTANMVRDFGSQFETESRDFEDESLQKHELVVTKCFYNTLCSSEGLPHLTKIFCALDRAIYSPITRSSHGVEFTLPQTLADEPTAENPEPSCNFQFVKRD